MGVSLFANEVKGPGKTLGTFGLKSFSRFGKFARLLGDWGEKATVTKKLAGGEIT